MEMLPLPRKGTLTPRSSPAASTNGVRSWRHTPAVTEEEIRRRVEEILLKRDLGDDLTSQEETILAYAHYAAGEQRVRMRARADAEAGE
jgi:hypothetical protein